MKKRIAQRQEGSGPFTLPKSEIIMWQSLPWGYKIIPMKKKKKIIPMELNSVNTSRSPKQNDL